MDTPSTDKPNNRTPGGRSASLQGKLDHSDAVEQALEDAARFEHIFVSLSPDKIRMQARHSDERRKADMSFGALDGVRLSVKDLFNVQGEKTRAGSELFDDEPDAEQDAPSVARLRGAGMILFGRTVMPELAFSGLGLNGRLGTPANPYDESRIPGGSTSGGAVSVARGIVDAALGSDTSGSLRIPAAFCGLVSLKPTPGLIALQGVRPLAPSLDSVGAIATDVATCAKVHLALVGEEPKEVTPASLSTLRILCDPAMLENGDLRTETAFAAALERLKGAGASVTHAAFPPLATLAPILERGGFVSPEAHATHWPRVSNSPDKVDPFVLKRLRAGGEWSAADWIRSSESRRIAQMEAERAFDDYDVLCAPTVVRVAPTFEEVNDLEASSQINRLTIRNTMIANILGLCSITLPIKGRGLPVGLMLTARAGNERRLLAVAAAVEPLIADF